ncbi:hypothetical protein RhiirA4_483306 [Rhizophagus irregularis]|uniref:Uncharacterized protein n=1 Tax=Rhizophagus irregularis TaxID=588596 RepID=A0A2I1HMC6_9GLOM|nr:hypothetical protein RhiirA4_483306 [Rhizophagus irregularis]
MDMDTSGFIEDGFLKSLFDKNLSKTVDKAQLLIQSNLCCVQILGNFATQFFYKFGDLGDDVDDDDYDLDEPPQDEHDVREFNRQVNELKLDIKTSS